MTMTEHISVTHLTDHPTTTSTSTDELVRLPAQDVVIEDNVRTVADLDPAFVASVPSGAQQIGSRQRGRPRPPAQVRRREVIGCVAGAGQRWVLPAAPWGGEPAAGRGHFEAVVVLVTELVGEVLEEPGPGDALGLQPVGRDPGNRVHTIGSIVVTDGAQQRGHEHVHGPLGAVRGQVPPPQADRQSRAVVEPAASPAGLAACLMAAVGIDHGAVATWSDPWCDVLVEDDRAVHEILLGTPVRDGKADARSGGGEHGHATPPTLRWSQSTTTTEPRLNGSSPTV